MTSRPFTALSVVLIIFVAPRTSPAATIQYQGNADGQQTLPFGVFPVNYPCMRVTLAAPATLAALVVGTNLGEVGTGFKISAAPTASTAVTYPAAFQTRIVWNPPLSLAAGTYTFFNGYNQAGTGRLIKGSVADLHSSEAGACTSLGASFTTSGRSIADWQFKLCDTQDCVLEDDPPTYVALGDSYSSGEGAGLYGTTNQEGLNMCHRSDRAWTGTQPGGNAGALAFPAAELRHSAACSGAVVKDLTGAREFPPNGVGGQAELAQLSDPLLPHANIVTITLGGNDALFSKILTECAWHGILGLHCDDQSFIPADETQSLRDQAQTAIDSLASGRLTTAYQQILQAAPPGAAVYVIGYPRIFGSSAGTCLETFQPSEKSWINEIADELNTAIACAAQQAGLPYVDVRDAFASHHVCAAQPWLHAIIDVSHPNERFHPNLAGQIGYALSVRDGVTNLSQTACPSPRALASGATPPAEQGELHAEADVPGCGVTSETFAPGQSIRLAGAGFAPSTLVALRLLADGGGYSQSLGAATTDSGGRLDTSIRIPANAPMTGEILLKATGVRASGATYSLYSANKIISSASDDVDADGIPSVCDNCMAAANPGQADADGDGRGDSCDFCPGDSENDADGDGLCGNLDPCPADPLNDADGDGVCSPIDRCPGFPNASPEQAMDCRFADGFESGDLSSWSAIH
jgi:lysophospholipase L1-like esterase